MIGLRFQGKCLIHTWSLKHGTHNKYWECLKCGKRKLELCDDGYQPIKKDWMNEKSK